MTNELAQTLINAYYTNDLNDGLCEKAQAVIDGRITLEDSKEPYKVYATMTVKLSLVVDAMTEGEAIELGKAADGGDFAEIEGSGAWEIVGAEIDT